MTSEAGKAEDTASVRALVETQEHGVWHCVTRIDKYDDGVVDGSPDEVLEVEGNVLCNDGIQEMLDLLAMGTGTPYSTGANAYLAVGSNAAAANATDSTLGTELDRKVATAVVTDQDVVFQATFNDDGSQGNWEEVGVLNAAAAGDLLNHLVSSLGAKGAGATWVLTLTITVS
jgi:hypothetical protein